MINRTCSDIIVDYLKQLDVEYVFGIPGGHITSLYDALARSEKKGGPRAVITRHESGAAFMAAGYARETGKIGVCCATTGPGTTNIISGVATAYADHLPLLILTGQTALPWTGLGALQECSPYSGSFPDIIDTVGMLEHCTCYNSLITHLEQLENKIAAALITAHRPLRGPAHLSIPVDILRTPAPDSLVYPNLSRLLTESAPDANSAALDKLWEMLYSVLQGGRNVVLFIGHECVDAEQEVTSFAETVNAKVVTTLRGKSRFSSYHPLSRGVFGPFGHKSARQALDDDSVGLILAVGASFGQWGSSGWAQALLNEKMIHIHHSNTYFPRSPMARLHVCGSVKNVFQYLLTKLDEMSHLEKFSFKFNDSPDQNQELSHASVADRISFVPSRIEIDNAESYHSDDVPILPPRLVYELMQNFPQEARFLIDAGNCLAWTIHYFFCLSHDNYRLSSTGQPCMGWAPGGAVGTAFGAPNTPVVCVTGDGSFLMYGQEITVAVAERLPVIFVILTDESYGMVKHRHRQTSEAPLDFPIPSVDFSLMAKAVGANGYIVRHPKDFKTLDYEEMCKRKGPTVLDVRISPDEPPPIRMI